MFYSLTKPFAVLVLNRQFIVLFSRFRLRSIDFGRKTPSEAPQIATAVSGHHDIDLSKTFINNTCDEATSWTTDKQQITRAGPECAVQSLGALALKQLEADKCAEWVGARAE
jgi:hypothetical protein